MTDSASEIPGSLGLTYTGTKMFVLFFFVLACMTATKSKSGEQRTVFSHDDGESQSSPNSQT